MTINTNTVLAAGLLAVTTAISAPAFAQQGGGGAGGGGGGFGPGGGGEGDDRVLTAPPPVSSVVIDRYPVVPPVELVEPESGCEGFLRLAKGPAAAFWQARYEYCERHLNN